MTEPRPGATRRDFLKATTTVAATSALAGVAIPAVHAAGDETIKMAIVGCGGRGTGAVSNAMASTGGPVKLVAMADVFKDKLDTSYDTIKKEHPDKVDVPEDRKYIGFDGYKAAIDAVGPGGLVAMATPPGFRWVQFAYAIEKGVNVFMEKPVTVDGPSTRKMLALAEKASAKNLKVGVGLMCRHCKIRGELFDRIQNGEIGDIVLLRAYRQTQPVGVALVPPKPDGISELMYQIQRFHGFLWASGGCFSDFLIHNIDECCWMKNEWPVKASGAGARTYRDQYIDQNFDIYSTEYTFNDGAKFMMEGRVIDGCKQEFASYVHGTKGSAVISANSHSPARSKIYKGQNMTRGNIVWQAPKDEPDPYVLEWNDLLAAIRENKPYNEAKRGAEASLVTSMGRMACHTGQVITFDDMLNCQHEFAPEIDKLTIDGPAPVQVDPKTGHYPWPMPGVTVDREY